jgi:hypothetical protein
LDVKESEVETSIKKKKYVYKIKLPDGREMEEIDRDRFTTFYYKDSNVMKTIFLARKAYKLTVDYLKVLFDPFERSKRITPDLTIFEAESVWDKE